MASKMKAKSKAFYEKALSKKKRCEYKKPKVSCLEQKIKEPKEASK